MDMNRLISMLTRMFFRTAMKTGIDFATRKGKPEGEMTPQDRDQAKSAKAMADKAQKASRLARRFLR